MYQTLCCAARDLPPAESVLRFGRRLTLDSNGGGGENREPAKLAMRIADELSSSAREPASALFTAIANRFEFGERFEILWAPGGALDLDQLLEA